MNPIHASQNDEGQSGRSIHNLVYCSQASADMEWVEAADIREVLEDALQQSADEKQQRMLSQMLSEIQSGPLGS